MFGNFNEDTRKVIKDNIFGKADFDYHICSIWYSLKWEKASALKK